MFSEEVWKLAALQQEGHSCAAQMNQRRKKTLTTLKRARQIICRLFLNMQASLEVPSFLTKSVVVV